MLCEKKYFVHSEKEAYQIVVGVLLVLCSLVYEINYFVALQV